MIQPMATRCRREMQMSRKRFTCRNLKNGYAAMGNALGRPRYPSIKGRDVGAAIAAERAAAARAARLKK